MEPTGTTSPLEHGTQPLDALLSQLGLDNHALVQASTDQLTHKQVQKARRGRRVSRKLQAKISRALAATLPPDHPTSPPTIADLFTYDGR
jgi:hypothetical protein